MKDLVKLDKHIKTHQSAKLYLGRKHQKNQFSRLTEGFTTVFFGTQRNENTEDCEPENTMINLRETC